MVSIDSWPADNEYPLGHYVKTLGKAGTKDTEIEILLHEFWIPCEEEIKISGAEPQETFGNNAKASV